MNRDIVAYYKARAEEYDSIYSKPERQDDLSNAATVLQSIFAGKQVLEIACGTGYWTERIAQTAASVFATDINETVLNVAKRKTYSGCNVSFGLADMYNLPVSHKYKSLFAGFIWSHIYLQDIDRFLLSVNHLVAPGGTVVLMDNNFVEGSSQPITNTDEQGNTFQTRKLKDKTTHLVLKNFPTEKFLLDTFARIAVEVKFTDLKYYWILSCKIPG